MAYTRTRRGRSPLVKLLAPYADALLRDNPNGVTTADLIELAREYEILRGNETHRELSGIGHVFKAVGAVNSGETRCSHLPEQKGVRQTVWVRSPYRRN